MFPEVTVADGYTTVNSTTYDLLNQTTTTDLPSPPYPLAVGFIAVVLASIIFGSNLLPIKKYEMGDGIFFQWIYCAAIWLTGFVLNGIRHFPKFHPLSMLGGFLWCTGNVLIVPILHTIGLSQGILIWACVNMISGWAAGRFGWFNTVTRTPPNSAMNYAGMSFCLLSAVIYMFLRTTTTRPTTTSKRTKNDKDSPAEIELTKQHRDLAPDKAEEDVITDVSSKDDDVFYQKFGPVTRRIFGISSAVIAGTFFGLNFTPVIYMQDNCLDASTNGLDYVFAHFTGIFVTSSTYMAIYCAIMCNRPRIYPQIILPTIISGLLWGIADICWFIANDSLSQPVSFPIIASLPGIVGTLWGMLAFGELRGKRNYIVLVLAICVAVTGSTLTGLSKSSALFPGHPPDPVHIKQDCGHM